LGMEKKNLLLWNYLANLNQTLLKWSLGGPLPNLCPAFHTSDQDHLGQRSGPPDTILEENHPMTILSKFGYVKLSSAVGAILVDGPNRRTHFWKRIQSQPNFAEMILGWSPSKFVSGISYLRPRWLPQPNLI
jgi:hypothetical protein